MTHDETYLSLVEKILAKGRRKQDRTGTGTKSLFGEVMRFDLQKGFPILTTKKVNFRAVVNEFIWMVLLGSTDVSWLQERGHRFWNEWTLPDGTIGKGYGYQFRKLESFRLNMPEDYTNKLKTYNEVGKEEHPDLFPVWDNIINKCYDTTDSMYPYYGGRGVKVCDRWKIFLNFVEDVRKLPRWNLYKEFPHLYGLDKDIRGGGYLYSPQTCMWASHKEINYNIESMVPVVANGVQYPSSRVAADDCKVTKFMLRLELDMYQKTTLSGIQFESVNENRVAKYSRMIVDQVRELLCELKHNPTSRRLLINLWNPSDLMDMALPPCHMQTQWNVRRQYLDCKMYQRSADMMLGVPWNIAFYALMTHVFAYLTGLEPGELIWDGGDCHIYLNHVEGAEEQLTRTPFPSPVLQFNDAPPPELQSLDSVWGEQHFELIGYQHHPAISLPISV